MEKGENMVQEMTREFSEGQAAIDELALIRKLVADPVKFLDEFLAQSRRMDKRQCPSCIKRERVMASMFQDGSVGQANQWDQMVQMIGDLREERERLLVGLHRIATMDYRGNRPMEQVVAAEVITQNEKAAR